MSKYIILTALILLPLIFNSCKTKNAASSDLPSAQHPDTLTEDVTNNETDMLEKMNTFSLGFYKTLSSSRANDNFSFSPASLNMALAVAYSGARNETQKQMSTVLGFDTSHDTFHQKYHDYFSGVMQISKDTLVEFNVANRIFLEESFDVRDEYVNQVQQWHAGAFEKIDFRENPRQAENRINTWVEEMTRERIQNLIPPGSLSQLTRLVLVNAIYMKSAWKYPFDKNRTQEKEFRSASGDTVAARFMIQRKSGIPYYEHERFIAMELPYATNELSLILIRPNERNVPDLSLFVPDGALYSEILAGLQPETVKMEIPLFKIESSFSLSSDLKSKGMDQVFNQQADFSGIAENKDLFISEVFQKVFIEIDEKGAEAAAATGAVMVTTSMPVDPPRIKEFIADRPFLFILKENRFNTPLFIGQYVK